jgi:hypothetical protein
MKGATVHAMPKLEPGIREENDNLPKISRMQLDLLHNSLMADFNRVATFQFTNSVGGARMKWLGVDEGHHQLSHEPDTNKVAVEKLVKINKWFCEEIAYFAKKLQDTPEPNGSGSMLDNTLLVWTNELGKGNIRLIIFRLLWSVVTLVGKPDDHLSFLALPIIVF